MNIENLTWFVSCMLNAFLFYLAQSLHIQKKKVFYPVLQMSELKFTYVVLYTQAPLLVSELLFEPQCSDSFLPLDQDFLDLAKQLVSGIILLRLVGILQMFDFSGISEW